MGKAFRVTGIGETERKSTSELLKEGVPYHYGIWGKNLIIRREEAVGGAFHAVNTWGDKIHGLDDKLCWGGERAAIEMKRVGLLSPKIKEKS